MDKIILISNPSRQLDTDLECLKNKPFKLNKGHDIATYCLYLYIMDEFIPTKFKQYPINLTGFVKVPFDFSLHFLRYKISDRQKFTKFWKFNYLDFFTKCNAKAAFFKYLYFSMYESQGFFRSKTHTNY